MPPKSRRKRQLEEYLRQGREVKTARLTGESSSEGHVDGEDGLDLSVLLEMEGEALNTDDETLDPSFDLDSSLTSDQDHLIENFCEDWVLQLDSDDKVSLGLFFGISVGKTSGSW